MRVSYQKGHVFPGVRVCLVSSIAIPRIISLFPNSPFPILSSLSPIQHGGLIPLDWGRDVRDYIHFIMPKSKAKVRSTKPFNNRTSDKRTPPGRAQSSGTGGGGGQPGSFALVLLLTGPLSAHVILSFSCLYPWKDYGCGRDDVIGNTVTTF